MPDWGVDSQELQEVADQLAEVKESVRNVTFQYIGNLGEYARYLCRVELEDTRYTGAMIQSFVVDLNKTELSASIYPTAAHSIYVRTGTRPHWAPIGPLKRWAAAKLGDENAAYAVQRSIATHGTSVYQMQKRGTMANPWPSRVVNRGDFKQAVQKSAVGIAQEILRGLLK